MGELVFNCLLLVACVVLACASLTVPIDGKDVLARYWPMGIMIVLVILLAIKTLRVLKKLPPEKRKFNPDFSFLKKAGNIRLVLAVVWLLVYSWFLPIGGYLVATILFCLGVMALLGSRNIPKMLLGSVCITIALFVIFSWGLRVSLPRGMGPLEDFGKWLEYLV